MMTSRWTWVTVILCLFWQSSDAYYPMVIAPRGTCGDQKLLSTSIQLKGRSCGPFTQTSWYILLTEYPNPGVWKIGGESVDVVLCDVDICIVPTTGQVATGYVWGISHPASEDIDETGKQTIVVNMERKQCEALTGRRHVQGGATIPCLMDLIREPGTSKAELTDILFIAGDKGCPQWTKAADEASIVTFNPWPRDAFKKGCEALNGKVDGRSCGMELCYTSAVKCTPKDEYINRHVCVYTVGESATECSFSIETGVSRMEGSSSMTGGERTRTVGFELGLALLEIFSGSLSGSVSDTFKWEKTTSLETTFTTTRKVEIKTSVKPGHVGYIRQLTGVCGPYRVYTEEFDIQVPAVDTGICEKWANFVITPE